MGFRFREYSLDAHKIFDLALTEERAKDGAKEKIPTTVGTIYQRLRDKRVEVDDRTLFTEIAVATETEKLTLQGPQFNRRMLEILLALRNEGVNPFSADWFWYKHDRLKSTDGSGYYSEYLNPA